MKELDIIALNLDLPEHGLKKDDVGTIVAIYDKGKGFEVEFITFEGNTIAVVTLLPHQIRALGHRQMIAVRQIEHEEAT